MYAGIEPWPSTLSQNLQLKADLRQGRQITCFLFFTNHHQYFFQRADNLVASSVVTRHTQLTLQHSQKRCRSASSTLTGHDGFTLGVAGGDGGNMIFDRSAVSQIGSATPTSIRYSRCSCSLCSDFKSLKSGSSEFSIRRRPLTMITDDGSSSAACNACSLAALVMGVAWEGPAARSTEAA
jgi:hypothetical protein